MKWNSKIAKEKIKKKNFLKNKLKYICFSTLKRYSFDKVHKKLSEVENTELKSLIKRKGLVIQKAGKGSTVVLTDYTKSRRDKVFVFGWS